MASTRTLAIAALKAVLEAKMATLVMPTGWPGVPKVRRRSASPAEAASEGEIVIPWGQLEFEPVEFGTGTGAIYEHSLTVDLEVFVAHDDEDTRAEAFDTIADGIAAAIAADRTLGGVVEDAELVSADAEELGGEGVVDENGALIPVRLIWHAAREHA